MSKSIKITASNILGYALTITTIVVLTFAAVLF